MYNTNIPDHTELPSNAQLIKATLAALIVAIVLLVTCILPAEYAIDPTGIGKRLGLLEMGEIKVQLEQEALQDEIATTAASSDAVSASGEQDVRPKTANEAENTSAPAPDIVKLPSAERHIQLKPGEAAELKLVINKGNSVQFKWYVDTGHVNFDTHGDNPKTRYHGYSKGKAVTSDEGTLTAAFDGKHGWFWRNRSKEVVTVTLEVSGKFQGIERVL